MKRKIQTWQEWQKACAEISETECFPETEQGKDALPYMTGYVITFDVNETQQQWQARCWEQYKKDTSKN